MFGIFRVFGCAWTLCFVCLEEISLIGGQVPIKKNVLKIINGKKCDDNGMEAEKSAGLARANA